MTLNQLIQQSGLNITGSQRCMLGLMIRQKAISKKVHYQKIEEKVIVSDYPEEFVPDMQEVVLKFISKIKKK